MEGSSLRVAMKEIKELNTEVIALKILRESRHSEILIILRKTFVRLLVCV